MARVKRQTAECPACGRGTIKLRTFYRKPVKLMEGPGAGRYIVYCEAPECGFTGLIHPDDAPLVALGRGDSFAGFEGRAR